MPKINKNTLIEKSLVYNPIVQRGLVIAKGTNLPLWTLDYDGVSVYGQLTDRWIPTGSNWSIKVTHYSPADIEKNRALVSSDTGTAEFLLPHAINEVRFAFGGERGDSAAPVYVAQKLYTTMVDPTGDVYVDDIQVIDNAQAITILDGIGYIGRHPFGMHWIGQIHRVELIDNDTPSNSIVISNLIASETQPTDLNIYNELNGQVIGTYFNGVYELAEGV